MTASGNYTVYSFYMYHVYEEYKRRYTLLDGLPEAIAKGKSYSGVYRVYTPSRCDISDLYILTDDICHVIKYVP